MFEVFEVVQRTLTVWCDVVGFVAFVAATLNKSSSFPSSASSSSSNNDSLAGCCRLCGGRSSFDVTVSEGMAAFC